MNKKLIKLFLASLFIDLFKFFSGYKIYKIDSCIDKNIKTIAIFSTTALGDFLLNTPAINAIKKHVNQAKIILIIGSNNLKLAQGSPLFDEIILWDGKLNNTISVALKLKKLNTEAAFMLHSRSPYDILVAVISRCKYIIKFTYKSENAGCKTFPMVKHLSQKTTTNNNKPYKPISLIKNKALFLESVGINAADMRMFIPVNFTPQARAIKTIGIHAGASSEERCWTINNFIKLIIHILKSNPDINIEIIGSHLESERNEKIIAGLGQYSSQVIDMAGKTTIIQLVERISSMECLVVGDTGPLHVAIALKTPVIGLFTDYNHSIAFGAVQDQDIHQALFAENGISAIKLDDVINAVENVINHNTKSNQLK